MLYASPYGPPIYLFTIIYHPLSPHSLSLSLSTPQGALQQADLIVMPRGKSLLCLNIFNLKRKWTCSLARVRNNVFLRVYIFLPLSEAMLSLIAASDTLPVSSALPRLFFTDTESFQNKSAIYTENTVTANQRKPVDPNQPYVRVHMCVCFNSIFGVLFQ